MSDPRRRLLELVAQEVPVALVTAVRAPDSHLGDKVLVRLDGDGDLDASSIPADIVERARELLRQGKSASVTVEGPEGEVEYFVESHPSPDTLLIFGGVHTAVHLSRFAKLLGFRVVIVDARGLFATRERFPDVDDVIVSRAEDFLKTDRIGFNTYVAVLTHDPKLDDPALLHFMKTDLRYLGAVGSRKTNAARMERLLEKGATPEQLTRIHAPIGLDLGADTPEEIALAIIAEIVAVKHGRGGGALRRQASQPQPAAAPA
jgi:xanthine dehydrogenase accessory factor